MNTDIAMARHVFLFTRNRGAKKVVINGCKRIQENSATV